MESTEILKYLEGRSSEAEKRKLVKWLDASPDHVKEFEEIRFVFEMTKIYDSECREFLAERSDKPMKVRLGGRLPRIVRRLGGVAAAVVLFFGAGYLTYLHTVNSFSSQYTSLDVPAGQRVDITLADGSRVWLNSGARLEYPVVFGRHERMVKLTGEAMFEVEHDEDHPFIVRTFASDVEVLGTRFNVVADEKSRRFSTILLDGSLRLTERTTRAGAVLNSGDEAHWLNGRFSVSKVRDFDAVCWTEGLISVRGQSFEELMRKFETAYNVRIEIARQTMPVIGFASGKIRISDGIDHALRVLQHTSDFTFTHDPKKNVVTIH